MTIVAPLKKLYTLRLALLAGVLLPVVIIVAAAGSWALRLLEEQVNQRMQEDIELIAHAIRLPLSHALERDRIGSINQALNSAFSIDVVYGAYVYDENGQEIARSGRRAAQVETDLAASLAASGDQLGEFSRAGDEEIFSYFVPLTDTGGRITGLLQLTRRGADFSSYIATVRQTAWITLISLGVLLSLLVLAGHHVALGRPLRRMLQGLQRIHSDSPQQRLAVQGPQEMQELGRGINNMLDRIDRSEKLATIGRLAAGVAHELGSPLATLDGKAQRALRRLPDDDPTTHDLQAIRTQAERMEVIIRQLLDYGRNNPLERVTLELQPLVEQAAERARQYTHASTRDRLIVIDGPQCMVGVDPIRFDQALCNLLCNALQAARHEIRVSWFATPCAEAPHHPSGVMLRLEDDGAGIADINKTLLFDPFYTTKPVGQGTGLGLAVAKAAINDHGGDIDIGTSSLGGACFSVWIPESH